MDIDEYAEPYDPQDPFFRFSTAVDDLINDMIDDDIAEVRATDMLHVISSCLTRLRLVWTFDEIHSMVHIILNSVEDRLQKGEALYDSETGEYVNMVLAEEREALGDEDLTVPVTVPEEWLDGES